ncbi:MAG TPA: response regulator transcription factor [Candidatus Baltobacteraceae bacterium]|nr:response regulator transcription factor [Candidatus Baltobacteraceae bacterium]
MAKTRAMLIEDHPLVRAGFRTELTAEGFDVVGEAADGPEGLRRARALRPDVLIVDIGLPGIDGIELTRLLRRELPDARVVILTMHDLEAEVFGALAAGADAYCLKTSPPQTIIAAVRIAAEGGAYFDPQIAHIVLRELGAARASAARDASPLSARETEILRLIADGKSNADIAEQLHLSMGTIKGHVRDVLDKLSASDRTQAAVKALKRGLI